MSLKDTKMEQLVDQLNTYSKQGIPLLSEPVSTIDDELYALERDWHDLIDSTSKYTKSVPSSQNFTTLF